MDIQRPEFINNTFVGYVPNPDGRGTLSLLFSCLLTLSLCVWSAIHLDLPPYGETDIEYTYRYLKWSVLGIFGPELVIWAAWRQFISARTLTKFIKKVRSNNGRNLQQWTMVHGFYAGMGGFVFDMDTPDMRHGPRFIPQRRLHVTPRGIQLLAKCGLLPDISLEDIKDKSKTDGSGKLICCFQVSWMVVQAAVRVAVGLPLTPLETNTIGHVVCALINYALWWYKPRWIKEPTILRGEWTRPICAFMYMSSQVSAEHKVNRDVLRDFGVKTEMSGVIYTPGHPSDIQLTEELEPLNGAFPTKGRITIRHGLELSAKTFYQEEAINEAVKKTISSDMQVVRWQLACEAIEQYPAIRERLDVPPCDQAELRYREAHRLYPEMPDKVSRHPRGHKPSEDIKTSSNKSWWCPSEELVVERPRNWPGDDLLRHMQGHLMGMILWCSSTVYGAIHVAGWNEVFPTNAESWFWRMSGVYIVFSGLLWSFFNLLGHLSGSVWWFWYGILEGAERKRSHILIYVLCCIGGTLYVIARVYLVLEAFISLRSLPASAYDSPSWILTVPHL
ncbi:uncharacterized protein TRIVIDRAFT_192994 [Trichoderma virens Gv29-8]|uniref:Uncharacterized protein n=1 Tax=Hypocrea virens (strain Gv29-8 / FGSC 10586) TaxID=413071 RepID=G9MZB4_HYPVG|nr:uncharacterized protein TRIVIDRAFT_192994 [Trichoderma virens Gv29-8]EHK19971.1 hypothetical protein TRIVIDRAFT_192994 [Trichoderma virens Gv29-8]